MPFTKVIIGASKYIVGSAFINDYIGKSSPNKAQFLLIPIVVCRHHNGRKESLHAFCAISIDSLTLLKQYCALKKIK